MQTKKILTTTLIAGILLTAIATPTLAGLFIEGRFQAICNTIDTSARGSDTSNDLQIWSYATLDDIPSARTTDGDIILWSTNTYKLLEAAACHILKIRDTLGRRQPGDRTVLEYAKSTARDVGTQAAQLEQINRNVLRLVDQSSNGVACVGADARRPGAPTVNSTTISQCTSRCIAALNERTDEMTGDNVNTERTFAQCIVRCASNTGNNYECARRYLDLLGGMTPRQLETVDARNGRTMAETTQTFINRCLSTPTYLDCHRSCDGSSSVAQHNICVSRCSGMASFGSATQGFTDNTGVDEILRASMLEGGFAGASSEDSSMVIEPVGKVEESFEIRGPQQDSLFPGLAGSSGSSACLTRCDSDRLNCIKASATQKDLDGCTNAINVCRTSCALIK